MGFSVYIHQYIYRPQAAFLHNSLKQHVSQLTKQQPSHNSPQQQPTMGNQPSSESSSPESPPQKNLLERMRDKKRSKPLSDADILKATGMTRAELNDWADKTPGVGKNQLAGKINVGETSGLGGVAAAEGYGGWGFGAEPGGGRDRGLKFPPGRDVKGEELGKA